MAEVIPKPGKTFDPALIPKAISDAGFSAPEIVVVADGTLVQDAGALRLAVPGLSHSFVLSGGPQGGALAKRADLLAEEIRVTGKWRVTNSNQPIELTVEDFQPRGKQDLCSKSKRTDSGVFLAERKIAFLSVESG